MKYLYLILIFFVSGIYNTSAQSSKHFTNETLRIDFVLSGNHSNTSASIFELKKETFWGGSPIEKDAFGYGEFRVVVKDSTRKDILFSRGFCTLFEEWQTTDEAKSVDKAFHQTTLTPFPKQKVNISIEKRKKDGSYKTLLSSFVDPDDFGIIHPSPSNIKTHKLIDNGSPDECVDIVFVGDGYTSEELEKFHNDIKRMTDYLFSQKPFNKHKSKFNIWAVDAVSENSGMTNPRKNNWKNTALKSSFNTFNSDRYLESTHTFLIRDYAGLVPYDQIYVLANTEKYGGGGIYNHFSLTSVDNPKSLTVFIHEFGHGFAGLGDEYYSSSTSYNDFFDLNTEPWQPNITTLVDFDSKWKKMIKKSTPQPTPATQEFTNKVGVYEGGGYVAKGIFRPYIDCRMKSNEAEGFCPVCQKAIEDMIMFLIGKK